MTVFFRKRGYPPRIIKEARDRVLITPREDLIPEQVDASEEQTTIPLVLTYHPQNKLVKNNITRNFQLLRDDKDTGAIFRPLCILCAYRRDTNLCDSLVRRSFNDATAASVDRGTFPCGRTKCNTCAHTNASSSIDTPWGRITVHNKHTCTSSNVIYLIRCRACGKVYISKTGRRLGDRFREYLRSTRLTDTDLQAAILRPRVTPSRICRYPLSVLGFKGHWTGAVLRPRRYLNTGRRTRRASTRILISFRTSLEVCARE